MKYLDLNGVTTLWSKVKELVTTSMDTTFNNKEKIIIIKDIKVYGYDVTDLNTDYVNSKLEDILNILIDSLKEDSKVADYIKEYGGTYFHVASKIYDSIVLRFIYNDEYGVYKQCSDFKLSAIGVVNAPHVYVFSDAIGNKIMFDMETGFNFIEDTTMGTDSISDKELDDLINEVFNKEDSGNTIDSDTPTPALDGETDSI